MGPASEGWNPNEWNRWRGRLDQKVAAMSGQLTVIASWVEAQRLAQATESGVGREQTAESARWARFRSWIAPNLPQAISMAAAIAALLVVGTPALLHLL